MHALRHLLTQELKTTFTLQIIAQKSPISTHLRLAIIPAGINLPDRTAFTPITTPSVLLVPANEKNVAQYQTTLISMLQKNFSDLVML